jgi:hypothetical protein
LVLANNELAGAKRLLGDIEAANAHEKQADQFTPSNSLFHWVIGRRLQDLGMSELAEKHLQQAGELDRAGEVPSEP